MRVRMPFSRCCIHRDETSYDFTALRVALDRIYYLFANFQPRSELRSRARTISIVIVDRGQKKNRHGSGAHPAWCDAVGKAGRYDVNEWAVARRDFPLGAPPPDPRRAPRAQRRAVFISVSCLGTARTPGPIRPSETDTRVRVARGASGEPRLGPSPAAGGVPWPPGAATRSAPGRPPPRRPVPAVGRVVRVPPRRSGWRGTRNGRNRGRETSQPLAGPAHSHQLRPQRGAEASSHRSPSPSSRGRRRVLRRFLSSRRLLVTCHVRGVTLIAGVEARGENLCRSQSPDRRGGRTTLFDARSPSKGLPTAVLRRIAPALGPVPRKGSR